MCAWAGLPLSPASRQLCLHSPGRKACPHHAARRLPFYLHCLLQLLTVGLCLSTLPSNCASPVFQHPDSARFFGRAAHLLSAVAGAGAMPGPAAAPGALPGLLPLPLAQAAAGSPRRGGPQPPPPAGAPPHAACGCCQVLGALMVLLGLVLPSFLLALSERAARAAWVAGRQPEGGWLEQDLLEHSCHSALASWLAFLCLLPLALSAVWHAGLAAALAAGLC